MRCTFRWCLIALAILAPRTLAQNLTNPGFQSTWSSGSPPGWSVVTSQLTATRNTVTTHTEGASCFIKQNVNPTSTFQHFAKEWLVTPSSAIKQGDWVIAKMRYYLPTTPSIGSGQIYARATGINTVTKADVGTQSNVLLVPSNSWQEVVVKYNVPAVTSQGVTIRVGLRFQNVPKNVGVYLDTVWFQGTSKSFGTLLAPVAPGWVEPDVVVQSNALTLKLDPYTGSLKSLSETTGGFEYLAALPTIKPLYSVRTGDPGGTNHLIDSTHYSYNIIRSTTDPLTSTTTVTVDSGPALTGSGYFTETGSVSVGATIVAKSNAPELEFKIAAKNSYVDASGYLDMIEEAQCPLLKLTQTVGASHGDDYVLLPGGDGSVTSGAGLRALAGTTVARDYPGSASCQLLSYGDPAHGLAVASLDTTGECKQFGFVYKDTATEKFVELSVKRRYPWVVNPTIPASYSVVVTPSAGDWSVAARWYRAKMATAPWRTSSIKASNPSPAWLQDRLPLYNFSYFEMGRGDWLCYPSDQRTVMDLWEPAATGVGSSMLVLARGCERYGQYILPVATPLKPDDTVVLNAWNDLKSSGHHVAVMMGGLKWAKSREQFPSASTYATFPNLGCTCTSCNSLAVPPCINCCQAYWVQPFTSAIVDNCNAAHDVWTDTVCVNGRNLSIGTLGIRKKDGALLVGVPAPGATWDSEHGYVCPHLADSRGIHSDLALYMSNHGADLYEFDQMNGGTIPSACYATNHGHTPGYGPWIAQSVHALFEETRTAGRGSSPGFTNPQFAISIEDPGELYVDVLDTYCGRLDRIEGSWPAEESVESKVVPLFQMLYSDVVLGQALDSSVPTTWKTDGQAQSIVEIARDFVGWGHFACELKPWMLFGEYDDGVPGGISNAYWPSPDRVDLKAMTLMRNCVTTENGPASNFFRDGRYVSTEGFAVAAFNYTDDAGVAHAIPSVAHGAWKRPNGEIGLVLAHCRNDAVLSPILSLPTGFDGVPVSPSAQVDVYVNGSLAGTFTPTTVPTCCFNPQDVALLVYR